jgi:hypothetical protein
MFLPLSATMEETMAKLEGKKSKIRAGNDTYCTYCSKLYL